MPDLFKNEFHGILSLFVLLFPALPRIKPVNLLVNLSPLG